MKGSEIVQVEGGHIIRSTTGRKDRHSKIFTAKGPRDRRVRLSAHTAIQFYDVQDRLGYDRPSKALDWLIHKAKNSINQLPPWNPSSGSNPENICNNNNNNNNPSTSSTCSYMQPTNSVHFPDFSSEGIIHRDSFQAEEDLGLSLQSLQADQNNLVGFQESFQRPYNWNSGSGIMGGAISQQGFSFSQRELLQSNLLVHAWNERPFAVADNNYPPGRGRQYYSDSGGHFDLGFHVPAQFYAEDGEGMNG